MEEFGQISLLPNLGEEIEEEDRIRQKEEENQVEALLFSLGRFRRRDSHLSQYGKRRSDSCSGTSKGTLRRKAGGTSD